MARMWRYAAGLLVAGAPLVPGMAWAAGTASTAASTVDPMDTFQEMRLECLVLADPAIGDTRLSFRKTGDSLEVRGTCESVSARRAAIDLITREHKGSVRDLTTIAVIPSQPKKPMQPAALQKMASRRIKELVPSQAGAMQVESPEAGHLVVTGLSLSMEDKVEVSRNLKKLAGVVSVRNDLRIAPMMRDGRMVTLLTSDGRRVLDGATGTVRPSATPARSTEPAIVAKPATNSPLQRVAASGEEGVVEKKHNGPKPRDAQPPEEAARAAVTEATRGRAQADPSRLWQPPPTVTVGGKPVLHPPSGLDIQPAVFAAAHAQAPGESKTVAWRNKNLGLPTGPVYADSRAIPRQTPNGTAQIASSKPLPPSAPKASEALKPTAIPELMPPPSLPASAPLMPDPLPAPAKPSQLKPVSAPAALVPPPLPVVAPAAQAQPPVIKPVSARMIEEPVRGRMIEETDSADTVSPAASPSPALPKVSVGSAAELKKAVEKACGRFAKKVTVTKADENFTVSIIVRGPQDEKAVIDRMLSIPEALSPQVRFEVRQGE